MPEIKTHKNQTVIFKNYSFFLTKLSPMQLLIQALQTQDQSLRLYNFSTMRNTIKERKKPKKSSHFMQN